MTTNTFLFSNYATTILAAPISAGATSLTVQSGDGAKFPAPNANQLFAVVLNDALTGNVYEVIYASARSGDTFTGLLRGQEGTAATSWIAGDLCGQFITAGQMGAALQRIQLQGNLNIYVNGSTGSDSNNGLTSGTAFATFQFAWNFLQQNYDLNGFTATIHQAGTNTDGLNANGNCIGQTTVSSVAIVVGGTWSVTNGSCVAANNTAFNIQGAGSMAASGTGLGQGFAIAAFAGAEINYQGVAFGACGVAHLFAANGSQIGSIGNYSITDDAPSHLNCSYGASIQLAFHTVTLTGTPAFSGAFAVASNCASINSSGVTFTGSATGSRYNVTKNASIDTTGSGATYFPGNSAGTTATGGQYN